MEFRAIVLRRDFNRLLLNLGFPSLYSSDVVGVALVVLHALCVGTLRIIEMSSAFRVCSGH